MMLIGHLETNGYYGTYVDLYLAEFEESLNDYLTRLDDTEDWTRILMSASEGDISLLNSLNLQVAWLNANTDAQIEWQWNGGHVSSEILGDSLPLYVDTMYGAVKVTKAKAIQQSKNGTESQATGTDISSWVSYDSTKGATFSLAGAASYRTASASKAIPAFDVMDYGQEDYVFGSAKADARHWSRYVLDVFEANKDTLAPLFNKSN